MKITKFFAFALSGLVFAACDKNNDGDGGGSVKGEPTVVSITLSSPNTYAEESPQKGTDAENKINELEFFIFDKDGNPDAIRSYYKTSSTKNINFTVAPGEDRKFLVAANMSIGQPIAGTTYTGLKATMSSLELRHNNSRTPDTSTGFHMSGETEADVIEDNPTNNVRITIARLLSKIEAPTFDGIVVELDDEDKEELFPDADPQDAVTFTFGGFLLINGLDKSDAFGKWNESLVDTEEWTTWSNIGKNYFRTEYEDEGATVTKAYSGENNGNWWLTDELIYLYENQPTWITNPTTGIDGHNAAETYAFLVQGDLTCGTETETRYWRINLIKDEEFRILRNAIYKVKVQKIVSKGYETPKEAEEDEDNGGGVIPGPDQTGVVAFIDIQPWRVYLQTTNM